MKTGQLCNKKRVISKRLIVVIPQRRAGWPEHRAAWLRRCALFGGPSAVGLVWPARRPGQSTDRAGAAAGWGSPSAGTAPPRPAAAWCRRSWPAPDDASPVKSAHDKVASDDEWCKSMCRVVCQWGVESNNENIPSITDVKEWNDALGIAWACCHEWRDDLRDFPGRRTMPVSKTNVNQTCYSMHDVEHKMETHKFEWGLLSRYLNTLLDFLHILHLNLATSLQRSETVLLEGHLRLDCSAGPSEPSERNNKIWHSWTKFMPIKSKKHGKIEENVLVSWNVGVLLIQLNLTTRKPNST